MGALEALLESSELRVRWPVKHHLVDVLRVCGQWIRLISGRVGGHKFWSDVTIYDVSGYVRPPRRSL